jgi:predicted lipoprotein
VDTTSRVGVLTVALPDPAGQVALQIGPVIRGTTLRDALPFISFDQFVNQLEYARVSNAMHDRLVESVLSGINFDALLDQEIGFIGVFTLRDLDAITITPVEIQVERPA